MKVTSLITFSLLCSSLLLHAENNTTAQPESKQVLRKKTAVKKTPESSKESNATRKKIMEEKIKEQMEREKKYAKEQRFYQGSDYDLKAHEVDPNMLPDVPVIEPEDDFDITDVYRDDI